MLQKTLLLSGVLLISGVLCYAQSTSTIPLPASSAPSATSPTPSATMRSPGTASVTPSPSPGEEDPLQDHLAAIIGVPTGLGLAFIGLGLCLVWLGCSAYLEHRRNKPDSPGTNLTNLPQSKSNTVPMGPVVSSGTSDPATSHVQPSEDAFRTEPDATPGLSGQEVGGAAAGSGSEQEVGVADSGTCCQLSPTSTHLGIACSISAAIARPPHK